ncbi:hypothetical protein AOLI_G00225240 [Acnodon oligacanthus]
MGYGNAASSLIFITSFLGIKFFTRFAVSDKYDNDRHGVIHDQDLLHDLRRYHCHVLFSSFYHVVCADPHADHSLSAVQAGSRNII